MDRIHFSLPFHEDSDPNIFLGRLGFASAAAIPFSLLWMFESLQDNPVLRARRTLSWGALLCATFVLLSLTPLIVAGSAASSSGRNFIYGPLHPLFGVYFLTCFVFAIYRLSKQLRSASGMRKLQLRYLLLGILLGGAGGTTTNLVVPLVWGTSRYSLLGPYFTLLMAGFAAHAIIRYRLLDIRVVIKSGVVLCIRDRCCCISLRRNHFSSPSRYRRSGLTAFRSPQQSR